MKKILEKVKSQIPKDINGFSCIKTQEVFIPYLEIGIECLIRDISDMNLFFESILKLVEIEIKDIKKISHILGVSFEIVKEAIVDMVSGEYINVSENTLRATKKGKEALKLKKLIEIKKKYINKIMINLITGEIYDGSNMKTFKVNKSSLCLAEEIVVSKLFLDSNYFSINQVFQVQQENDSVYEKSGITKELYKIVNISYRNLVYIKNEAFIYKSDGSEEIQIQFATDANDKYLNCLYSQLKSEVPPCLDNFFERSRDFIRSQSTSIYSLEQTLITTTRNIKEELRYNDDVDLSLFEVRRYALVDKEYINYFIYSDEIIFDNLFIYTDRINTVLSGEIFDEIARIAEKKTVFIIYDKNEFNASKTIEYSLGKSKSKNLFIIPSDKIEKTVICFEPYLMIEIQEQVVAAFDKFICFKTSIMDFDRDNQKVRVDKIKEMYGIESVLKHRKDNSNMLKPKNI